MSSIYSQHGHHWAGLNPAFDPLGFRAFVYLITNMKTGKKYIGLKYFYKYIDSKSLAIRENDWRFYMGSCKPLREDIETIGAHKFRFEILRLFISRTAARRYEEYLQNKHDVLRAVDDNGCRLYYNNNIAGHKFVRPHRKVVKDKSKMCAASKRTAEKLGSAHFSEMSKKLWSDPNTVRAMRARYKGTTIWWRNGETIRLPKGEHPTGGGWIQGKPQGGILLKTPYGVFPSSKAAANAEGCAHPTPMARARRGVEGYEIIREEDYYERNTNS
jgi:hypothetical protein